MPKLIARICAIFCAALVCGTAFTSQDNQAAAEQAAMAWLALVDSQEYQASWNGAAALFQSKVSNTDWIGALNSARKPLGAVVSRELISATPKTSLPGVPEGEYMVLRYQTEFDAKSRAIETVTPVLDEGEWKVSGYFIK